MKNIKKSGNLPTISESQISKIIRSSNGSLKTLGVKKRRKSMPQRINRKITYRLAEIDTLRAKCAYEKGRVRLVSVKD